VKAMEARLVRAELQKCHRGEGVNHYKNCKEIAEMYAGMIRENKVSHRSGCMGCLESIRSVSDARTLGVGGEASQTIESCH